MKAVPSKVDAGIDLRPLRIWEKCAIIAPFVAAIVFGVLVEMRSAFMESRKTDVGTYFRAGWAVRSGANLYQVTDNNGWHYCYPPVFAVLMVPLADAPEGESRNGMLPYSVSVAIWYAFNVGVTVLALHWFAKAIEELSPTGSESRKWWRLRLIPFCVCLAPIGCSLSRGQANIIVVAFLAGMFLAFVRGHRFRSGLWLSAAICLKIFPIFLLIFPLWQRHYRSILGVACGLLMGLVLIPSSVWGLSKCLQAHFEMVQAVILPGLGSSADHTRDKELMEITATDNQSIQAVIHNYMHSDSRERPSRSSDETKLFHVIATAILAGVLLMAYGRDRTNCRIRNLLLLGGLIDIMAIASPVSHTHYFCLALPLVVGLTFDSMARPGADAPNGSTLLVLIVAGICFALPMIPICEARREIGLSLFGSIILWIAAVVRLRKNCPARLFGTEYRTRPQNLTRPLPIPMNCNEGMILV